MKTVDLKDEYRTETNEDVYSEDTHYGGSGSFSDEYVKWLETKLKNNEALDLVSVSDRTIEDKATELSQKLTDDEGEQFDIQDNFRDGAKWMRAMIKLHSS